MKTMSPRRAGEQVGTFRPSGDTADPDRLNRIAAAFLCAMIAEKKYVSAGREFLRTVDRMEQRTVVDTIVYRLSVLAPHADPEEIRMRTWRDLGRHFGWHDLRELEPAGAA
jgi:hypothetical protein